MISIHPKAHLETIVQYNFTNNTLGTHECRMQFYQYMLYRYFFDYITHVVACWYRNMLA